MAFRIKPKITPLIGDIYFDNECNQVMTEFFLT
jgi:hypothetical protein